MNDEEGRLDAITGAVLLAGAGAGIVAMAVGAGLLLAGYPGVGPSQQSPPLVLARALRADPIALMEEGILLLMATPVLRVVTLVLGFLWLRRIRFAVISLVVLAVLFVSFTVAAGG